MNQYFKLLRVKHWIKNLLLFIPVVTALELFNFDMLGNIFLGFVQFSLLASAVYVINDMMDVESDRVHPTKCNRPLASGCISINEAKVILAVLLVGVAGIAFLLNWHAAVVLAIYFVLNVAYSVKLKHVVIVDIIILSSGYLLRILFASMITGIPNSQWLFLTVLSASLFLAFGKRRGELKKQGKNITRATLREYPYTYLDKCMYMAQTLMIVFYSLWSFVILESNKMIYTVPLVIVILLRYNLCLERDSDGDPVTTLIDDKVLLLLCVVFCVMFIVLLYIK